MRSVNERCPTRGREAGRLTGRCGDRSQTPSDPTCRAARQAKSAGEQAHESGDWAHVVALLHEALRVKAVRVGEVARVEVNRPQVGDDRAALRDEHAVVPVILGAAEKFEKVSTSVSRIGAKERRTKRGACPADQEYQQKILCELEEV